MTACGFFSCSDLEILELLSSRDQEAGMPVNSPVVESNPTWTVCSKLVGVEMTGLWSGPGDSVAFFPFLSL